MQWSITKKNTESVLDTSKEVSLEVNAEKTKYMLVSYHQTTGQNQYMKLVNESSNIWELC
jgi:hypothetical protein